MNKAAPWNVRGVGLDTREAAREAARRAGLSLGDWLDSVIAEQAQTLGIEADDIDADDRLDAVTAKLSQMTGKPAPERKAAREDAGAARDTTRPLRAVRALNEMENTGPDRLRGYGHAGPAITRRAEPEAIDPEALLDAAVARMERRTGQAQKQTNAALESVAARLGDIEQHISTRRDDSAILPIKSALGRLEERIESLSRRPAPPRTDARVEASLRDLTDRLDDVAQKIDRSASVKPREPDNSQMQRLDARLSSIMTQLQESETRRSKALEEEITQRASARRPAQPLRGIAEVPFAQAVSEIERRQRDLDAGAPTRAARPAQGSHPDAAFNAALERRLEQIAAHVEKAADSASGAGRNSDRAFASLQDEIARLAVRLDAMREEPPKAPEIQPDLLLLKRDIAEMSRGLSDLAPRGSVAALETAVRDLATRVEMSRQDGTRENLLAPVENLVSDLHATLKNFDPRQPILDLDREVKTIGRKVETMTLAGFDPDAFKRIHSQSQEIRDLLTAAASRPLPFDKLEKQIASLGTRVDHLAQNPPQGQQADVASAIGEIRTMVDRAMGERGAPSQYVAALEKRLESLAQKIDQAVARPHPVAAAPAPDTSALERMIARLAERIEATRKSTQDPAVFEQLQQQIAHIGQRLDTSDAGFRSLGSIERSIGELFDGLEKNRIAAISAAENAARLAATDAAEKAARANLHTLQHLPLAPQALAQSQAIQRDLLDIRAEQDAASKRGHSTLNAVHGTLEKIVDRLATLEHPRTDPGAPSLEETRRIATEVAETAARIAASEAAEKAARTSLRDLMQNPPQHPLAVAQSQAIQRDLIDIRAEQDAASKRGHATLNAVHGTLEKIVDRLATLEHTRVGPGTPSLEETRRIATEVAETAARMAASEAAEKAARTSLREMMQNPPQHPQALAQSQAIQRDLLDIRAEQDAAGKRGHATLNAVHGMLEKIVDRLATLENTRPEPGSNHADTHTIALEAARTAARETINEVRDLLPTAQDTAEAAIFRQDIADLRNAQEMTGERTHSTLKAVHQTLERVVDRLSTLETEKAAAPRGGIAPDAHQATPARLADYGQDAESLVFSPAARRYDVAVDAETLRPRATARAPERPGEPESRRAQQSSSVPGTSMATADGLDILLEPGGMPPHRGSAAGAFMASRSQPQSELGTGEPAAADAPGANSFIAAARRAAQAAAQVSSGSGSDSRRAAGVASRGEPEGGTVSTLERKAGALDSAKAFVRMRKKPILIGLTGLVVILGATMVVRTFLAGPATIQKVERVPQDAVQPSALVAKAEPTPTVPDTGTAPRPSVGALPAPVPALSGNIASAPTPSPAIVAPAIPGDVASRGLPRARGQVTITTPAGPLAPVTGVGARAGTAVDETPVGSIDGKARPAQEAALTGISTPLRTAALAGNAAARYEIGMRYVEGRTVARDLKLAAQWLEQAANQGLAPAQYRLGSLYEKGLGVTKDLAAARSWYQKAADGGNIRAMHNLAVLTAEGIDGKPDYASAAQWFKKAAEAGVRDSQYNLAILYARGLGIEQSLPQSYTWFAVAAAMGDEDSGKKRDEVAAKMDGKTLAAAKLAVEGFHPAAAAPAGNDVTPPPGGWDVTPQRTETGVKNPNKA